MSGIRPQSHLHRVLALLTAEPVEIHDLIARMPQGARSHGRKYMRQLAAADLLAVTGRLSSRVSVRPVTCALTPAGQTLQARLGPVDA